MSDSRKLYRPKAPLHQHVNISRRQFIKRSSTLVATSSLVALSPMIAQAGQAAQSNAASSRLAANPLGFNGERKDPVTGLYHLGNGYRVYSPRLMCFHATDSMSPFGKGGINSYAYCLGDPVNLRDPSGHFAILSMIISAIIGAVAGAAIAATAEGIRAATTGTSFDWKQVGIGAALGLISGGFGAAATGAKTGVQVGLAVADAVVSGAADFGLNVAAGTSPKDAGINAGVGAVIGLTAFGVGDVIGRAFRFNRIRGPVKIVSFKNKGLGSEDYRIMASQAFKAKKSPYSGKNVWTTNYTTRGRYVKDIVKKEIKAGNSVTVLSGTHGSEDGIRDISFKEREFFREDRDLFSREIKKHNVDLIDITEMSEDVLAQYLKVNNNSIVCSFCYSQNDAFVQRLFNLEPTINYIRE